MKKKMTSTFIVRVYGATADRLEENHGLLETTVMQCTNLLVRKVNMFIAADSLRDPTDDEIVFLPQENA